MEKKVTIYSLAKELGYTPSMVSRALSENGKVSEDKRQKVLALAEKYNFTPNKFASRMSQKIIRIGCIIVSKSKRIEAEMLKGFESAFSDLCDYKIEYNVTSVFALNNPDVEVQVKKALEKYSQYDGIIASGLSEKGYTPIIKEMNIENFAFLQNINNDVPFIFASKHNECLAAQCAADFIYNAIKNSDKKVFLFTGNQKSSLHFNAKKAFLEKCDKYKMFVSGTFDMLDDESVLKDNVNLIGDDVGAVYITSGNSLSLCEYVKNNRKEMVLVCTDTYEELNAYLLDGTIALTIDQNIKGQAYKALYDLAMYIIKGQKPDKICYTDFKFTTQSMLEG